MGKMSKVKGSSFENNIAKQIRNYFMPGVDPKVAYQMVHRTPMSGGHVERGDLIIKPPVLQLFPWFIECRNREVWDWKQIWERGMNSVVMKWFMEDAVEKCHPYDQNTNYWRLPLLLFTKNQQKVYFAAWEDDLSLRDLAYPALDPKMYVASDLDKRYNKKYVVIGDFDSMLALHHVLEKPAMLEQINKYLGVTNESSEDLHSS